MADTDLIERLNVHAASWRRDDAFKARDPDVEAAIAEEASTAITERDKRIAELERLTDGIDEDRRGALHLCIERNKEIQAITAQLTASRAECEGLRAAQARPEGLSAWAGWDQERAPWGEAKHKDAVLEALFRGPWSVEDAATLIRFIDRTWGLAALSQKETGR